MARIGRVEKLRSRLVAPTAAVTAAVGLCGMQRLLSAATPSAFAAPRREV